MEKMRMHIRFFGQVQGVGFRYTASHQASRYGLTGWVKNEYDGTVTAEVQGREADIDAWTYAMQSGRYIQIDRIEKSEREVDCEERSFRITY